MTDKNYKAPNRVESAASEALRTIATAATEATRVVASAASEAAKVINAKGAIDHDLLIELKTRMESLKCDIKDLKDGTKANIEDHERRIFSLEVRGGKQGVLISIGYTVIGILVSVIFFHLLGIKI